MIVLFWVLFMLFFADILFWTLNPLKSKIFQKAKNT